MFNAKIVALLPKGPIELATTLNIKNCSKYLFEKCTITQTFVLKLEALNLSLHIDTLKLIADCGKKHKRFLSTYVAHCEVVFLRKATKNDEYTARGTTQYLWQENPTYVCLCYCTNRTCIPVK